MLTLYHYPLCAKSRLVRVLLKELGMDCELKKIDFWQQKDFLATLDPLAEIPALVSGTSKPIVSIYSLIEYLLDLNPQSHLLPIAIEQKAEMRRVIYWLNQRFDAEITKYIINEKLLKLVIHNAGSPKTEFLRAAKLNLKHHLNYLNNLIYANGNLASSQLSVADIFLGCHVSVLDYFGEIDWENLLWLKEWYAPIKSRPTFRSILTDRVAVITPPNYYEDPDF